MPKNPTISSVATSAGLKIVFFIGFSSSRAGPIGPSLCVLFVGWVSWPVTLCSSFAETRSNARSYFLNAVARSTHLLALRVCVLFTLRLVLVVRVTIVGLT